MSVVVVTAPEPVVSYEEAKKHLRVDHDDDQALIETLVAAATAHIDGPAGWLGRAIGRQTLSLRTDGFPACRGDGIQLPFPPFHAVTGVVYRDDKGVQQTLPEAGYEIIDGGLDGAARLAPAFNHSWPAGASRISIEFSAGYEDVPAPIKVAILMLVGQWYERREAVVVGESVEKMPFAVEQLLAPFRVWSF